MRIKRNLNSLGNKISFAFVFTAMIIVLSISLYPSVSAEDFVYNYAGSGGTSSGGNNITNNYNVTNVTFVDGIATCPSGYVVQNITANGTGIYSQCISQATATVNVNSTQFDDADPIHIDESWLTSKIEDVPKWSDYANYSNISNTFLNRMTGGTMFGDIEMNYQSLRGVMTITSPSGTDALNLHERKAYSDDGLTMVFGWVDNVFNISGAYVMPTTDGTANQTLVTDGNGIVSWGDAQAIETDTLDSVTTRGATTTNDITVNSVTAENSTQTGKTVLDYTGLTWWVDALGYISPASIVWLNNKVTIFGTVRIGDYDTDGFVKTSDGNGTLIIDTTEYYPLSNPYNYTNSSSAEADPKWTGNSTQVSYLASNNTFTGEVNTFKGINTTSLGTFNCWGSGLTICKNDTGVFFS